FACGACLVFAASELVAAIGGRVPAFVRVLAELAEAPLRLGREGRSPAARERRRLLVAGAACAFGLGSVVLGPLPGVAMAAAGPWIVARLLAAVRERYRRAVEAGAAGIALALADA